MEKLDIIYESKGFKIDEAKRTVVSGVLEEDIISSNDRFYPALVVQTAIKTLPGKRSLIGHESDSPEDVVAKIVESGMEGKIGYAAFKFGTDSRSEMMFQKVRDGLVNSVSIRASGETKRGKIGDRFVDVVEKLDVYSVDWVVEGGIPSARVVQVYEQSPTVIYETDKKEEGEAMEELEKMKKDLEEAQKKVAELQQSLDERDAKIKESEEKAAQKELEAHRESKLATLKDDETKSLIREQLTGKTKEEIDAQFDKHVKYLESLRKKVGVKEEVVINPTDGDKSKELHFSNPNEIFESEKVSKDDKVKVLKSLLD